MRNHIDIDHTHSRAIVQEIGERLRGLLREETELPSNLKGQMERLRDMDDASPSIVPGEEKDDFRSKPHLDDRKGQARPTSWRRRNG